MNRKIITYLNSYRNKNISLLELERLFTGDTKYEDFAREVKTLEEKDILRPVKSHQTNGKSIPLYNTYRINKSYFKNKISDKVQNFKIISNPNIELQRYFELSEDELDKDFPFIKAVNEYLDKYGLPKEEATSPERSYEIVGDEKWIDEKGGKKLLEKLNLWDKLKITYKNDPLMIGINPKEINKNSHIHMIVENKTTFHNMLDALKETTFTSLIYGAGWKVVSNIVILEKQLGLEGHNHKLLYFGDIDFEGISIWSSLNQKRLTCLAKEFYSSLLKKSYTKGKENQRVNKEALDEFLKCFSNDERERLIEILANGGYYPQESLNSEELNHIWRSMVYELNY